MSKSFSTDWDEDELWNEESFDGVEPEGLEPSAEQRLIRERIPYWSTPEVQSLIKRHGLLPETAEQLLALALHKHYDGDADTLRPDIQKMLRQEVARRLREPGQAIDDSE